jgi:hypothetical protein
MRDAEMVRGNNPQSEAGQLIGRGLVEANQHKLLAGLLHVLIAVSEVRRNLLQVAAWCNVNEQPQKYTHLRRSEGRWGMIENELEVAARALRSFSRLASSASCSFSWHSSSVLRSSSFAPAPPHSRPIGTHFPSRYRLQNQDAFEVQNRGNLFGDIRPGIAYRAV